MTRLPRSRAVRLKRLLDRGDHAVPALLPAVVEEQRGGAAGAIPLDRPALRRELGRLGQERLSQVLERLQASRGNLVGLYIEVFQPARNWAGLKRTMMAALGRHFEGIGV